MLTKLRPRKCNYTALCFFFKKLFQGLRGILFRKFKAKIAVFPIVIAVTLLAVRDGRTKAF